MRMLVLGLARQDGSILAADVPGGRRLRPLPRAGPPACGASWPRASSPRRPGPARLVYRPTEDGLAALGASTARASASPTPRTPPGPVARAAEWGTCLGPPLAPGGFAIPESRRAPAMVFGTRLSSAGAAIHNGLSPPPPLVKDVADETASTSEHITLAATTTHRGGH